MAWLAAQIGTFLLGKAVQPRDLLPSVYPKVKKRKSKKMTMKKELKDLRRRLKIE